MSVTSVDQKAAAGTADDDSDRKTGGRLWIMSAIVAGAAVLAGFYGIDAYSAGTNVAVATSSDNSKDFETVFRDLLKQRSLVMSMAADVLLQDTTTMEAFARKDRATLVVRMEPFFEQLKKTHSVEQLNFWLPPATIYYRAGQPNDSGADVSKYRRTVVAANERRQPVIAVETGIGGRVDVRAIMPIVVDGKFAGSLEFASNLDVPLERASATAEVKWAIGISKEVSERVACAVDSRVDVWQKDDVFYLFSDPQTAQFVRSISFDLNAKSYTLATDRRHHAIFARTFPVIDFGGTPSIIVAIVGEGMARRTASDREGASVEQHRFIATEFFGRKALFACQPHNATVTAETAVLAYEFDRRAFARLIGETPELVGTFATALAHLARRETYQHSADEEPPPDVIDRLINLYRGQIEANYGPRTQPASLAAE